MLKRNLSQQDLSRLAKIPAWKFPARVEVVPVSACFSLSIAILYGLKACSGIRLFRRTLRNDSLIDINLNFPERLFMPLQKGT